MACCGSKGHAPSNRNILFKGAVGLAKSALHVDRADPREISKRLDICRECAKATRNRSRQFQSHKGLTTLSRCTICKCFVVSKTKLKSEICPIDKW